MKLYTRCISYKSEISFHSSVNDRGELEMEKGKEFPMTCPVCHKKHKYHVNDFTAEKSLTNKLFLIVAFVGLTVAVFMSELFLNNYRIYLYGGIFIFPSLAYLIIAKQQQTKLNSFNRFKVKE